MPPQAQEYEWYSQNIDMVWEVGQVLLDGTELTYDELLGLRGYRQMIWNGKKRAPGNAIAMKLLRSLLNKEQRTRLRKLGDFIVTCPSGNQYRLRPNIYRVERLQQFGKRRYPIYSFCIHDRGGEDEVMTETDVTIGHMLMLLADEDEFLATANATTLKQNQWDGEWRKKLNRAKREREAQSHEMQNAIMAY